VWLSLSSCALSSQDKAKPLNLEKQRAKGFASKYFYQIATN
jgi:hypothetical protein